MKEYRGGFAQVRDFISLRENTLCKVPTVRVRTKERKCSLVVPAPHGVGGPGPTQGAPKPNWERLGTMY